jgi:hypothetical protein
VEALASQAGPVEVAALSHPAQQSLEQQQAVQAARQGPQDLAARRAQATRWVQSCCVCQVSRGHMQGEHSRLGFLKG